MRIRRVPQRGECAFAPERGGTLDAGEVLVPGYRMTAESLLARQGRMGSRDGAALLSTN
jgi:hypothetical protein